MAFMVSPGVNVSEIDLTSIVPAVSTTEGAIAGVFRWGPVNARTLVSSETELVKKFGKPTNANAETFFTAADFLAYSNKLYVSRAVSSTARNAGAAGSLIISKEDAETPLVAFYARYPGAIGNDISVSYVNSATSFSRPVTNIALNTGSNVGRIPVSEVTALGLAPGDIISISQAGNGSQDLQVESFGIDEAIDLGEGNTSYRNVVFTQKFRLPKNISVTSAGVVAIRRWGYSNRVSGAPRTGLSHIVVVDKTGVFTGKPGSVLESYENVSIDENAKKDDGSTNYYKNLINERSNYIYAGSTTIAQVANPVYLNLTGGVDGSTESTIELGALAEAYMQFASSDEVNVSFILQGKAIGGTNGEALANFIIDNICEVRKDCIAFISPAYEDVVNANGSEVENILQFVNSVSASSYAFMDSGYKYRYDKYNDVYRYTPLNGDVAGLAVRTDRERDAWWSPAGYNRGFIKNLVKLAFNPSKDQRDVLYPEGVNAVITEAGTGTLLFGDKTLLGRDSAFDRINVRRLFIVLEKTISRAAKSTLFEFNDQFTRANFRNMVEPFLRDVQGRRGIYDFRVVCDETNNTPEVIDRNEFVGSIFVKPARSINFIQLNFVAVRSGVEFDEVVGSI